MPQLSGSIFTTHGVRRMDIHYDSSFDGALWRLVSEVQ